jgi:hypothetical protein
MDVQVMVLADRPPTVMVAAQPTRRVASAEAFTVLLAVML